jgi:hypothetical protein
VGRIYVNRFSKVTVSALQDLLSLINGGSPAPIFELLRFNIQNSDVTLTMPGNQQLTFELQRLSASGLGSGGTTTTPNPIDQGDSATSLTAHQNDTSSAGSGTVLWDGSCNIFQGIDLVLAVPIPFPYQNACLLKLTTAPLAAITLSGSMWYREIA